ncbi:helix-turn-helix transcriptional regulator [Streptomyces rimosus]|uniref:helix-turn-helix domain-containing protein n=1 Tax=Streptomyces rimosus TaxID=1927 RepID=UPI0004CA8B89|nr:helix-turn-helix transcriptional regulator [Streptomyces rimosus]
MPARRSTVQPSTVLGRQLGDELRQYREAAGLSTSAAAEALDCTKAKISRIENGRVPVRVPDLMALLHTYGVGAGQTLERLTTLARSANRRRREGWWNQYGPVLEDTYRDYIALEAVSDSIRTYQSQLIPGLLQTPAYARAVTVASKAWQTPDEIEQFVKVRAARQERLTADQPLSVWAVMAEGVLHQRVGGADVMRAQLEHLVAMTGLANVTVQVLPFSRGAHGGMFGPYLLLSFPQVSALDVVLMEHPTGHIWLEQEPEVARYRDLFDDARTSALSPAESVALIERIISKEYRA